MNTLLAPPTAGEKELEESPEAPPPRSAPPGGGGQLGTGGSALLQRFKWASGGSRRWRTWRNIGLLLLAILSVPLWRSRTRGAKPEILPAAGVPVAVAKVTRQDLAEQIVCDAELLPYQEVDLHSKVAGFLQDISVDIGDHVRAGQLLATIEIPELEDDLHHAEAAQRRNEGEVARAEAAFAQAHLVHTRLVEVGPRLIAQQELDDAQAKDLVAASAVAAARAEVEVSRADISKLQTMLKYSKIVAPFTGVITKRYADPGALIQGGTSSQSLPLVRLSQNDRLRLEIPVSVSYVSRVNVGDQAQIKVDALGRTFLGTIARAADKVDTDTRTMQVQVDVPNPDRKLIPGMYASVVLRLNYRPNTLAVPVEAVSRQKSCTVLVVNKDDRIEERTISLGLETPREIEVLSGLKENDLVMIGSRTQVKSGQRVEPKLLAAKDTEE